MNPKDIEGKEFVLQSSDFIPEGRMMLVDWNKVDICTPEELPGYDEFPRAVLTSGELGGFFNGIVIKNEGEVKGT